MIKEASSISSIVSLGYPEVVAKVIRKMFGENSHTIAKWLKEYYSRREEDFIHSIGKATAVWGKKSLTLALEKYTAAEKGIDAYQKFLTENDFYIPYGETLTDEYLIDQKEDAKYIMEESIKDDIFFYNSFLQDIMSGKLTDLNPYKRLSFNDAVTKYNKKKIFQDQEPVLSYPNEWRWINVGKRCELVGSLMNNCGSAGVMSDDPDKTIITLFDDNNKPHVLVTYSPNQKRVSGYEGRASSGVKDEYSQYVISLTDHLGAKLDIDKSESVKSKYLSLTYQLRNFAEKVTRIPVGGSGFIELFEVLGKDGIVYYTNSYSLISTTTIEKFINLYKDNIDFRENELPDNPQKIDYILYLFNDNNIISRNFKEKHKDEIKAVRHVYRDTAETVD
jgi:hypothetical protein